MSKLTRGLLIVASTVAVSAAVVAGGILTSSKVGAADGDLNFFQRAAQILGIEETDLSSAFKQAKTEEIDQLVADGKIDEERAAEMKTEISDSEYGFPMMEQRRERREEHQAAMAEFLGISVEELEQAHQDGKRMPDLLEEFGKTEEELRDFMSEKFGDMPGGGPMFKGGMGGPGGMGPGGCMEEDDASSGAETEAEVSSV